MDPTPRHRAAERDFRQLLHSGGVAQPDLVEYGKQFGLEIQSSSAPSLAELLAADAQEWRRLIKQVGFTAES
jgi:hypothetical protein